MPSVPFTLLDQNEKPPGYPQEFYRPQVVTKNQISQDPSRQFHYFRLKFPTKLNPDALLPRNKGVSLPAHLMQAKPTWTPQVEGPTFTNRRCTLEWRIAEMDTTDSRPAVKNDDDDLEGVLEMFLKGTSLHDNADDMDGESY